MNHAAKPARHWLLGYQIGWLKKDAVAGLTTSAVVIPKCMAFAGIAGLPLEVGLYAAFVPMVVYALLGSCRRLSVSTTTTIAILVAGNLAAAAPDGAAEQLTAAVTLTVLVGVILVVAGLLRLGFLANFISDPVLTGFKAGLALVIVVDQLPKLFGFHIEKEGFLRDLWSIVHHLPASSLPTVLLAVTMVVLLITMEHFVPKAPAPLVAVALSIAAAWFLGLSERGVELVGAFPGGLPRPMWPDLSLVKELWPGAMGIALMAFTESIAAGRSFVEKAEPRPEANRELIALGLSNLAGGLTQAMPAGGGTAQTAVNASAGARSQAAELVTAAMVAATLLLLGPVVALMPLATLAAVVIATTLPLINIGDFRAIVRVRQTEFLWALTASAGVVLLGTLEGILVAVTLSVLTLMYQANRPPIYEMARKPGTNIFRPRAPENPADEVVEGLLIIRTEGRLTFASAPRLGEKLWELVAAAEPRVIVADLSAVPDIEYTALSMFMTLQEKLQAQGIELWLSGLNPSALTAVRRAPLGQTLGRERMFYNLENAVEAHLTQGRDDGDNRART
jgi:high affinity sulfate transporter 1